MIYNNFIKIKNFFQLYIAKLNKKIYDQQKVIIYFFFTYKNKIQRK